MSATYRLTEIVGTSEEGVVPAIESALARASETLRGLDWFEVVSIRGSIQDAGVKQYQVVLKVGFKLDS